jgi:hypothetical protein
MKRRIASLPLLTILCLPLAVAPVTAGTLYSNGPINGTTDAWTINSGLAVSDSLRTVQSSGVGTVTFGVWLFPGDSVSSVQIDFGSSSFGTDIFSGVEVVRQASDLGINQFGFDLQQVYSALPDIPLPSGTTWLTLSNAVPPSGDPIYWDENSGVGCMSPGCPSLAYENTIGSIPSEAFTLTGTTGTTPEPSSILLFGSGILGLAGVLRRKLNR